MELVEGEDLSAIIARGSMALSDTLPLARLIIDFLRMNGGPVEAFELSPGDVALSDQLPNLTAWADLDRSFCGGLGLHR